MRKPSLLALAASGLGLLMTALPAAAATGDLVSIALRDFNRDGKIDRAVVAIANPGFAEWSVGGVSGFTVTYDGAPVRVTSASMASPASDPALLELVLESADVPVDTSAAKFEVAYAASGASGVRGGGTELMAFAADDATEAATERDEAAPILVTSNPLAGSIEVFRGSPLTLSFSEAVDPASLVPSSALNPGAWSFAVVGSAVTVEHFPYIGGAPESFGIAAKDLAGNASVAGPYPNPFSFRTTSDSTPATRVDNVFVFSTPTAPGTLPASGGAHIAWYTNLPEVASVRLSYSLDAGISYAVIATLPVAQGIHVWYPPQIAQAFQLRAEGLNASGTPVASAFLSPISLVGTWAPAPTPVTPAEPAGPDATAPTIVGVGVIDRFDAAARTAKLSWTTDEPTRAEVRYGVELDYRGQADLSAFTTAHEVTLHDLTPGVLHQARITSVDAAGNASVSKDWYFIFLREGDLIKGSGAAVYRYEGGKRRAFPHLDVYRSWHGDDFSKVIRVPDTQLGTIALGANMKMKEGVYLVKIQSDPKTYAVEPNGILRWIQTETHARALYGAAWASRVRDVDVSLFTDYAIGAPLANGETPAGYAN